MPELPEVETVRRFLEKSVLNHPIVSMEVLNQSSFDGDPLSLIGLSFTRFTRRGKQLSAHLSNGLVLLFHLKMTGQIIHQAGQTKSALGHPTKDMLTSPLPNRSTRVVFHFKDHSTLYFNDQRKFGWIKLFSPADLAAFQQGLGIDVLDPGFTLAYFQNRLSRSSRPVKSVLLDQDKFAGIGNIYANDALFLAKIHPLTPANTLLPSQLKILHASVIGIIKESIDHGGSTARDQKYLRPDGSTGSHQYHFRVYQKEGEPCPICATRIQRISIALRGTFFCPRCQQPA